MIFLANILFVTTSLVYLAASELFLAHLTGRSSANALAPRLMVLGVALQAASILLSSVALHVCPVRGVHFALSVVSFAACVLYVSLRRRYRLDFIGAFIAPLALTFHLASRFGGSPAHDGDPAHRLQSVILPVHVITNVLGDALFLLAFATALGYLIKERLLKQKRLSGIFRRLPPLDSLERAEHAFLLSGFVMLTIGLMTGTVWAARVEAGHPADVMRAVLGYTSWFVFAAALAFRASGRWRGRRASYITIFGFLCMSLVMLLYVARTIGPLASLLMELP